MLPDTVRSLDQLAAACRRRGRAPDLVLAVGRAGRMLHASGPVDTQFRIGSITKTFTAALVLQLRDAGRLDLDDPLDRHLPGTPVGEVTIRQLLIHTSGLPAEPSGPWWERSPGGDVAALLAALGPLVNQPGSVRHYSNLGYGLLGAVIERLGGESWWDRLRGHLLEPLGLHHTSYHPVEGDAATGYLVHPLAHPNSDERRVEPTPDTGAMAPAGQLWSTAGDLLAWARVLGAGQPGVVDRDTAAEMRTPAVRADVDEGGTGQFGGLGPLLSTYGDRLFCGHGGSMPGFLAGLLLDPPTAAAAVAFANCYTGPDLRTLTRQALSLVIDTEPDGLGGAWWWMGHAAVLTHEGGDLLVRQDGETWRLEPAGADRWRCVEGAQIGETLLVHRDGAGAVDGWEIRTFSYGRDPWPTHPS